MGGSIRPTACREKLEDALKLFFGGYGGYKRRSVWMVRFSLANERWDFSSFTYADQFPFCQNNPLAAMFSNELSKVLSKKTVVGIGINPPLPIWAAAGEHGLFLFSYCHRKQTRWGILTWQ